MDIPSVIEGLWASRISVPPDLIQSLRGTETHTRNDYLGRAVFEFFQNAVDRAEARIDIALTSSVTTEGLFCLIIANDGKAVSIDGLPQPSPIHFPTESGDTVEIASSYNPEQRSDFQALCNIHNSNKQAGQSIGNKGVGFKSAWEFAKQVTVASTLLDGRRYAFRFHQNLDAAQVRNQSTFWPGLDERLRAAAAAVLDRDSRKGLPSFYFPEYVANAQDCFAGREWAKTVVILEGINETGRARLVDRIGEFRKAPLFFINQLRGADGLKRALDIEVTTQVDDESHSQTTRVPDDWTVVDESLLADLWPEQLDALCKAAQALNFSIARPSLALAFPPEKLIDDVGALDEPICHRFFCYLPTYVDCGFGVQIHADFMLDMSRKNIEVNQNPYNKKLLHLAGRLLGRALRTLPELHQRVDVVGFLLPGNANNPAVDELKRGLACEFHLPVDSETADAATLQAFLSAIFPPTRSVWPELRYIHTLKFLRTWCARVAYERDGGYRKRTAPYINLIREQQAGILPERADGGVVQTALPLPLVDADGRLRDGRGIFWRRKVSEGLAEDVSGLSLAETGVDGLAVTEWDKLDDGDQALLGLLNFNLGEIAHRLRLRIEEHVKGQMVVSGESLPFHPAAVLRFVAGLLSRTEQAVVGRIALMGYLETPAGNADNLSRMLLPIVGGGWRIGREVMLPGAVPCLDRFVETTWCGASVLDMDRLKTSIGLTDDAQARQLALTLGAWPCLPLRQVGEAWALPFDLNVLKTSDQRLTFYSAFIHAWTYWLQAAPVVAEQVANALRVSSVPWLPLEAEYNLRENDCARPAEVLLVNERDRTRQVFLLKKVARDATEQAALQAIGVVAACDASIEKLVNLLAFMGKCSPNDESLRGRYRGLVFELGSRVEWASPSQKDLEWLKSLPLLVTHRTTRNWLAVDQAKETWFVPRTSQHLRSEFRDECTFLEFDPDTRASWVEQVLGARRFAPKLQMGSGDWMTPDRMPPPPCLITRELLQTGNLADLMLIAESATVGGGLRSREVVEEEWRRLMFRRGERVWLQAMLDGQQHFIGEEVSRRDVLLNDSGGQLEIWHDIPLNDLDINMHLFAEPLAIGVFGNRLLTDAFAAYLGAGERQEGWMADRYGVGEDERSATRNYLVRKFLAGETLDELITALYSLPEWRGRHIEMDALKAGWWDTTFYVANQLALDAAALHQRIPPHLVDHFPLLDPSIINERRWEQSFDSKQLYLALLTEFIDQGAGGEFETSGLVQLFMKSPSEISRFDFDPLAAQQLRVQPYDLESSDYQDWCQRKRRSLNWLSAERIVSGEITDLSVLAMPVSSSELRTTVIASVRQTGTRRVKQATQSQREEENRNNHQTGLTAEHRVVLASARNLLASSDKTAQWANVLLAWAEVCKALDGLPMLPDYCPGDPDPHELARILHSSVFAGDGLGFDVIEVGEQLGQVWLSEVKSATGGRLFLSENERLKALQYEACRPGLWRLKVWLGNGQWADNQLTTHVLDTFKDIDVRLNGCEKVRPDGWEFQLG